MAFALDTFVSETIITTLKLYNNNENPSSYTTLSSASDVTMTTTGWKYKDFIQLVDEDGNAVTFNFNDIDTVTYDALNAAADLAAVVAALEGLQELNLNITAGLSLGKAYSLKIFDDRYQVVDTDVSEIVAEYFALTTDEFYELYVSNPDLFFEFDVEAFTDAFLEFYLTNPDQYYEFYLEAFQDAFLEFIISNPDLFYEFTVREDDSELISNLNATPTVTADCSKVTVSLAIALLGGETVTVSVTKDEEVITLDSYAGTDTSYTFNTTEDGLYQVQVVSNQRGVLARRSYVIDCRTRKCLTRIAVEDVENDMYCNDGDRSCKQNPDYVTIFAAWRGIYASFALGSYSRINEQFARLKKYCKECNQACCGC